MNALMGIFENGYKCVAKKAPTLRQILSPSLFVNKPPTERSWLAQKGTYRCGHTRCRCCTLLDTTNTIVSSSNHSVHEMKQYINCNTRNIIYLITCTESQLQYVGHTTQSLKNRINKYVSDIPHSNIRNVSAASQHFHSVHDNSFQYLKVQGVERVFLPARGGDFKQKLLNRETLWMFQLGTTYPRGLNRRLDLMLHY